MIETLVFNGLRGAGRGRAKTFIAIACALPAAAQAQADSVSGAVGLASDKVVRGMSQSGARPSLLLDLVYRPNSRWAFSLGAASLGLGGVADNGRGTGSHSEVYLAAARSWQLDTDWTAQLGGTAYTYPGSRDPFYREYVELGASVAWRGRLSLAAAAVPSFSGKDRSGRAQRGATASVELGAHGPPGGRWGLDAGLGLTDVSRLGNRPYSYGSAGLSWRGASTQVFVSWITSRADERNGVSRRVAGDRAVLTLWWSW